jgi:hypothetical protein
MAGLKLFKGSRGRIMRAVMNAMLPRGGAFKAGAADYDIVPRADELLQSYSKPAQIAFPFILYYVQYNALLRCGLPFTLLSTERAGRYLEKMESSPFYYRRSMILLLKLLTFLAFYEIDEVAAQIGYVHGCHLKNRDRATRAGRSA